MKLAALTLLAALVASSAAMGDIVSAPGGLLRVLDKMSAVVVDYDLSKGQSKVDGKITVTLDDCRYPSDLPTGEAYAHLTITDQTTTLFKGWMIASSPALSALDHPRYDVWVLRCDVPS